LRVVWFVQISRRCASCETICMQNAVPRPTSPQWCCCGRASDVGLPNHNQGTQSPEINFRCHLLSSVHHSGIKFVRQCAVVTEKRVLNADQVPAALWWCGRSHRLDRRAERLPGHAAPQTAYLRCVYLSAVWVMQILRPYASCEANYPPDTVASRPAVAAATAVACLPPGSDLLPSRCEQQDTVAPQRVLVTMSRRYQWKKRRAEGVGVNEISFERGAVFGAACAAASGVATSAGDRGAVMEAERCGDLMINEYAYTLHITYNSSSRVSCPPAARGGAH
jgi:hypothetical protein